MSLMELDPPDYWLVDCPDGPERILPLRGIWLVAPLDRDDGQQVLLARVSPAHRLGFAEVDFVVIEPRRIGCLLHPTRHGATRVWVHTYSGQYTGQTTIASSEMACHWRGAVISRRDWAEAAQSLLEAGHGLPDWAMNDSRPDAPPERSCRWRRARP